MSVFKTLNNLNVSEHVEKKGGFSYLSWTWAVSELRKAAPTATWEVIKFNGVPFCKTECGYFVEVAVTVEGITLSQIHPVLDNRNKTLQSPDAFQINTSIQRCLVKAIALHGLGLYIYAGEDLPESNDGSTSPITQTTPAPIIPASPKTETLGLTDAELNHITDMAQAIKEMVSDENVGGALDLVIDAKLEEPQFIGLNNMLDSKTRSALRAEKEARKAKK